MNDAVNPAESAAPDANVLTQTQDVADPSPAVVETDAASDKPKGVQKRLDELTRNWREAERREAALLALLQQQRTAPEAPQPTADDKPKTLADFEYDEGKFQAYIFDQAEKRAADAAKRELTAAQEREATERRKASFRSRSAEFAKTVEDFDSVARNPDLPISADMAEVIQDSDDGPALLYHLGKNPDIAEKIAQLPPKAAARELGKIEARLAYEREKAKPEKVSKAPPPPPKVEGANPGNLNVKPDDPDSDKLSDAEWARLRNKQISKRSN
jgi:hypothetical protein